MFSALILILAVTWFPVDVFHSFCLLVIDRHVQQQFNLIICPWKVIRLAFFLPLFVLTAWIYSGFGWIWLSLNIISRQHERFENGGSSTGLLRKFTAGSTFCACPVKHSSFPLNKINEGSRNEIVWPSFWGWGSVSVWTAKQFEKRLMWTENILYVFAAKVAFSNLSGLVWA